MSRRKGIVLIVDDEEEIRESIEMLLNSEGLFTDTAADGEEGLKKIEENLYDAVLLDLMLPGRSGMEVQKDIRRIDPTLPVIIITAIGALETAVMLSVWVLPPYWSSMPAPIKMPAVTTVSPPPPRSVALIETSLQQRLIRNCAQLTSPRSHREHHDYPLTSKPHNSSKPGGTYL